MLIEELCPSPLLFLCLVPFGMYLDDDEDISILVELVSYFCKSELNGYVINKVFEYLNNAVGFFQYCMQLEIINFARSSLWIRM